MDNDRLRALRLELRKFLATISPASTEEIDETTPLTDQGIVDSLGLVELQLFIEARLGRELSSDDLKDNTLLTIDAMARWLYDNERHEDSSARM